MSENSPGVGTGKGKLVLEHQCMFFYHGMFV